MKISNFEILLGVAFAAGLYFFVKQKSDLSQYQNAYNVLAEQLTSGKLVAAGSALATPTTATTTK